MIVQLIIQVVLAGNHLRRQQVVVIVLIIVALRIAPLIRRWPRGPPAGVTRAAFAARSAWCGRGAFACFAAIASAAPSATTLSPHFVTVAGLATSGFAVSSPASWRSRRSGRQHVHVEVFVEYISEVFDWFVQPVGRKNITTRRSPSLVPFATATAATTATATAARSLPLARDATGRRWFVGASLTRLFQIFTEPQVGARFQGVIENGRSDLGCGLIRQHIPKIKFLGLFVPRLGTRFIAL